MGSSNVEKLRAAHQAFNQRKLDDVVRLMAEDAVYRDHARGATFNGRNGFMEFLQGWTQSSSNARLTEVKYIDAGDAVVAEFIGRGVNDGPMGPYPATGREFNLHFCEVSRFNAQGQIVSGGLYYDMFSMLTQLGHLPAVSAAR
jgi:steroid delta-isomerase-like uncharacterized protein